MKFIISGKNIEVTNALKDKIEKKLGKLGKFFKPDTEVHATLSVQKNRQIAEVTIFFDGVVLRAEEASEDMYASIDRIVDILERQIRKNKTRLAKRLHENAFDTVEGQAVNHDAVEEEYRIVKIKKFAIKPMSEEEAILQMNLLGHQFFVFQNAETGDTNVVYKRKDGNYGLIEPEF